MSGSVTNKGRGKSSWQLKWEMPRDPVTGKRRYGYKSVKAKNKGEAKKLLADVLHSLRHGTFVEPDKLTLGRWLETWLTDYAAPAVSAKTLERYRELLMLHVAPHIGAVQLQKLEGRQIQKLYKLLREVGRKARRPGDPASGLAERTMLHVHRVLSQALDEAARQRLIPRNPVDDVKSPKPDADTADENDSSEKIYALDRVQLDVLLRGFKPRAMFQLVVTAAGTGMRRGELLALRWSDIAFDSNLIRVQRSVEETKKHGLRFKLPKNKGSRRTIGIDAGLSAMLRAHKVRQQEEALKLGQHLPVDALVFPRSPIEPAAPKHPRGVTKEFVAAAAKLGFPAFRFHDLRHTHATLLLTDGVPLNTVSQRLGHSKPTITLTVYGHVLCGSVDQSVAVVGSLLEGALGIA